ncbi:MAG: transcriptional regulator [Micrococcaceae bacterium]|nr:transcriptional regulator [Micrococcaceae bacterium]
MSPATDRHDEHPRMKLSEPLAHPVRFSLVAAIAGTEETEFRGVPLYLHVSVSVPIRHASHLQPAGMVKIRKGFVGKRPRTWFSLTRAGRGTWERHLAALRDIAGGG